MVTKITKHANPSFYISIVYSSEYINLSCLAQLPSSNIKYSVLYNYTKTVYTVYNYTDQLGYLVSIGLS